MAITSLEKTTDSLYEQQNESTFLHALEEAAQKNALLICLTRPDGEILYSVDEYNVLYEADDDAEDITENPYKKGENILNWQKGALRNLPHSFGEMIERLNVSASLSLGYIAVDESTYIYGTKLDRCAVFDGEVLMCISMPLGAVGITVDVLRSQLLLVSLLSFLLAFMLAYLLAKRFEKPIGILDTQTRKIAAGEFVSVEKTHFCSELDNLANTLNEMSHALERLENSRRELIAGVSHDLRTPLTMIKGYTEMLREFSWQTEETRNHDLSIIEREADRLTALVNEILEYSSIQSKEAVMQLNDLNISDVATQVAEQFDALYATQGYVIETEIQPNLHIQGDMAQLERVLYNFVDNAIHHGKKEKHIVVRLAASDGYARFGVQNFGTGISEDEIPYIWERYYTAGNHAGNYAVSGLGLAIAKEILIAHGAQFGVICNNGCEFWFRLPILP